MRKYRNKPVVVDGIRFDSQKEATRWQELRRMEKAGDIQDLQRQQVFPLLPTQKRGGKIVERAVSYRADFTYRQGDRFVVEDTKGVKTPEYIIKRKLMLWVHGIAVRET